MLIGRLSMFIGRLPMYLHRLQEAIYFECTTYLPTYLGMTTCNGQANKNNFEFDTSLSVVALLDSKFRIQFQNVFLLLLGATAPHPVAPVFVVVVVVVVVGVAPVEILCKQQN